MKRKQEIESVWYRDRG